MVAAMVGFISALVVAAPKRAGRWGWGTSCAAWAVIVWALRSAGATAHDGTPWPRSPTRGERDGGGDSMWQIVFLMMFGAAAMIAGGVGTVFVLASMTTRVVFGALMAPPLRRGLASASRAGESRSPLRLIEQSGRAVDIGAREEQKRCDKRRGANHDRRNRSPRKR